MKGFFVSLGERNVWYDVCCMHRIAVVIPTKNEARYLPRLLSALKTQTVQPDEVVVADAGSTDKTVELARTYGAHVVPGGNAATGRNNGAAATTSEYIFFFDADAIIDDHEFLAHALAEFNAKTLDIATSDFYVEGGTFGDRLSMRLYNHYVRLWGARHPHPMGTFILARRDAHVRVHGFDPTVTFAEDHDYGLRVRDSGGVFGVLDGVRVGITTRRQEKIGRLRYLAVNVLAEPHIMMFGSIRSKKLGAQYDKVK